MKDEEPPVRAGTATALGKLGGETRVTLPALNELRNDEAKVGRLAVVEAINKIASHGIKPQN